MKQRILLAGIAALALLGGPVAAQTMELEADVTPPAPSDEVAPPHDQQNIPRDEEQLAPHEHPRDEQPLPPMPRDRSSAPQDEVAPPHEEAPLPPDQVGTHAQPDEHHSSLAPRESRWPSTDQVRQRAREAFHAVNSAQAALLKDDYDVADQSLHQAEEALLSLYQSVPGAHLDEAIELTERQVRDELAHNRNNTKALVDTEPLLSQLKLSEDYIDPAIAKTLRDGLKDQRDGHSDKFMASLAKAKLMLAHDTSIWPVEDAYARVLAARTALDEGRTRLAERLMLDVPDATQQVLLQAPLVPIRFELRAAASAQADDNTVRADKLTRHAVDGLRGLTRDFFPTAPQLQALTDKANHLEDQLNLGKAVKPDDLRKLADDTRNLVRPNRG